MRITKLIATFLIIVIMTAPFMSVTQAAGDSAPLVRFGETNVGNINVRRNASPMSSRIAVTYRKHVPILIVGERLEQNELWYLTVTWGGSLLGGQGGIAVGWIRARYINLMDYSEFMIRFANYYAFDTYPSMTIQPAPIISIKPAAFPRPTLEPIIMPNFGL